MDRIKFLGTAGARFVVSKQVRASGGLWFSLDNANFLVDPGPGTLLKCATSKPRLDPITLDGIILTHRHLDHSTDVNVMIEAMTQGGFKSKGELFTPADALNDDPVVLRYLRHFLDNIHTLEEGGTYSLRDIGFNTPVRHIHGVETYGIKFQSSKYVISLIADTRYFPELPGHYSKSDLLILNVVRHEAAGMSLRVDHLNLEDVKVLIKEAKPRVAIMTHFGMTMVRAKPWELADKLSDELGTRVIAARDGMDFKLDEELR